MERVLRDPESLGGAGGNSTPRPMISPPKPVVLQPGSSGINTPPPARATEGGGDAQETTPKIRAFDQRLAGARHEDNWNRSPNVTGTGAIHVKSFHAKLTGESLEFLDKQINEWLDAHPQYEVKFVNSTVGEWTGKLREPNLIVQLWV